MRYPITDPEDARLQKAYDDAREEADRWNRTIPPNPDRPHILKLLDGIPITSVENFMTACEEIGEEEPAREEAERTLRELRAYRASKEKANG